MAQLTATFETGINGNNILATDSGSANAWDSMSVLGGNVATYDNTHPAHGSLGGKFDNTVAPASNSLAVWQASFGTVTEHWGRVYIYITANPAATFRLVELRSGGIGGAFACSVRVDSNGKIALADNTATTTGLTAISLNQPIRIEFHIIHSATIGQMEAKLFNTKDSTTVDDTITSAATHNTLASVDTIGFGLGGGGSAGPIWMDDIVANALSYPGPAVVSVTTVINSGGSPLTNLDRDLFNVRGPDRQNAFSSVPSIVPAPRVGPPPGIPRENLDW